MLIMTDYGCGFFIDFDDLDPKSDPRTALNYCISTKRRSAQAESIIIDDLSCIIDYVKFTKQRWPEAEKRILKSPLYAFEYASELFDFGWPNAEPIIRTDFFSSKLYANRFFKGKWDGVEDAIEHRLKQAINYSKLVCMTGCEFAMSKFKALVRGPLSHVKTYYGKAWPSLDAIIKSDSLLSSFYCMSCLGCISLEHETIILRDAISACHYLVNVKKNEWPEMEPIALACPENALCYAVNGLNGRFLAGEQMILSDASCAHQYAKNILKSEWKEAEHTILSDAYVSLCYTLDLKLKRWHEAEAKIRDSEWKQDYEKAFNCTL